MSLQNNNKINPSLPWDKESIVNKVKTLFLSLDSGINIKSTHLPLS
jgi:hypothetical protein